MNENVKDQEQQSSEEKEIVSEETIELLNTYKHQFTLIRNHHQSRAERITMLQHRHSAKKLSEKKKARLQRRHAAALKALFEADQMLDQINVRISQVDKLAPFIPTGL